MLSLVRTDSQATQTSSVYPELTLMPPYCEGEMRDVLSSFDNGKEHTLSIERMLSVAIKCRMGGTPAPPSRPSEP